MKHLGLPTNLKMLQELDVEFRRSTPIHWLQENVTAGVHALKYGVHHGGDSLQLCRRSTATAAATAAATPAAPATAAAKKEESDVMKKKKKKMGSIDCTVQSRWIDALLRACAKYKKTSKRGGVVRASKIKLKQFLQSNFNVENVVRTL